MKKIGRFKLESVLGIGENGIVFEGKDPESAKKVAVKVFLSYGGLSEDERREFRERFLREAKVASKLVHPNIVSTLFWDEEKKTGHTYLVMEFLEGEDIKARLAGGESFDLERTGPIVGQAASALDYAHSSGVIHRDIKPANLHLSDSDLLKVTDFGIARISESQLTRPGQVLGTPFYMSPEQIRGEELDGRSDLFSLACVAYEMLTGRKPFGNKDAKRLIQVMKMVLTQEPESPSRIDNRLPSRLDEVFARGLSKKRDDRFSSGEEFYKALTG